MWSAPSLDYFSWVWLIQSCTAETSVLQSVGRGARPQGSCRFLLCRNLPDVNVGASKVVRGWWEWGELGPSKSSGRKPHKY